MLYLEHLQSCLPKTKCLWLVLKALSVYFCLGENLLVFLFGTKLPLTLFLWNMLQLKTVSCFQKIIFFLHHISKMLTKKIFICWLFIINILEATHKKTKMYIKYFLYIKWIIFHIISIKKLAIFFWLVFLQLRMSKFL